MRNEAVAGINSLPWIHRPDGNRKISPEWHQCPNCGMPGRVYPIIEPRSDLLKVGEGVGTVLIDDVEYVVVGLAVRCRQCKRDIVLTNGSIH